MQAAELPPPLLPMSSGWQVGAIGLFVSGAVELVSLANSSADAFSVARVAAGGASIFVGVKLLKGVRWARWGGLLLMTILPVATVAYLVDLPSDPPQSDVEGMQPIIWMGGLMWIAMLMVPLIWLMATPRAFRFAPAGWLRDPLDPFKVRFWSGAVWTEWTAPLLPQAPFSSPWRADRP